MSFLGKVFGKKPSAISATRPSESIKQLRDTEDILYKKQNYLEEKIDKEIDIARTNATKNKKGALQALQRKRRYQQQLDQINGTINTIEIQRQALEAAATNTAVLSSMKNAADALKATNKLMNVDQLDEMLEGLSDQRDLANDISNAISQPVIAGFVDDDIDEDELERELAELELRDNEKNVDDNKSKDSDMILPAVPQTDRLDSKKKTAKTGASIKTDVIVPAS